MLAAGFGIVTKRVERGLKQVGVGQGWGMSGFSRARNRLVHQLPRGSRLAEQQICEGEVERSSDAGVRAELGLGLAIAFRSNIRSASSKMSSAAS